MTLTVFSRWAAWLLVCAVVVFTLSPIELRPVTAAPTNWERFAAFTTMGALFCLGYPQHRLRVVWLVIGMAGLLEVLQHLVPSRHGRLPDGIVKAVGALLGAGLVVVAERAFERCGVDFRLLRSSRATSS
ncbi:VanZ family protein [Microvirga aerilata]|uniref:VanZ family protein n=2 Tax=Microvirga aerilata TaxID=670292 RepID=A0A936ZKF3_9HYPH|nr:VanZ family protein [Microvirga aerilata]MBL0406268.1 VanZ family protein [Microvirga aerilata]